MASPNPEPGLRLLIIDHQGDTSREVIRYFTEAGHDFYAQTVGEGEGYRQALDGASWDAVICLLGIPGLTPTATLRELKERQRDVPLIVIAENDERAAIRAMRSGAHDGLTKDRLARLVPAVEREVREARHRADHRAALEMLRASESRFRALASNLPGMVFHLVREPAGDLRFLYVSEGCHKLFGIRAHELLSSAERFFDVFEPTDRLSLEMAIADSAAHMAPLNWEGRIRRRAQRKWVNLRSTPRRGDGGVVQWQGIATNISHSKEIEGELRRSREQLSELSSYLEAAKEEERERIARDIHDELGSILVAIKIDTALLASKLPEGSQREKAVATEKLLDQAMSTASRVARELRPGILKEFGLSAAIECQAEDFSQRTGILCRFTCDDDTIETDEKTSLAMFRMAQEALTNVAKHAHASLVVMRLGREPGNIVLEVRDNGRGVSEADMGKPKSFGLRGIRERVHSLAGEFSIEAPERGGTHLTLRVPDRFSADPGHLEGSSEDELQQKLFKS